MMSGPPRTGATLLVNYSLKGLSPAGGAAADWRSKDAADVTGVLIPVHLDSSVFRRSSLKTNVCTRKSTKSTWSLGSETNGRSDQVLKHGNVSLLKS